ncbi:F0F1 ATP synthase subunit B [Prauserella sp. PE36]|uniref:ATP synthase subunit b n=1 Tax=Prauserella endophytica TaxID=1592324 RepID=A0ABY2RYT6_9PSEU|nr:MULTISPECIES: F0F1 ATP synthase subunit B [Prauserella]PXY26761.1 F0F1 ATP synthase subunit B [Prauserella coralliicola]RBM16568.1 F0F1 ATP synthase subunit B [Prauserella sp. PE36]TKG66162.1 F0F1 ATP synthase subunit B [Prauserella endophytica]
MLNTQLVLAAEGAPNPVVPHLSEIILGFVAFLLLLWVLRKFAVPRFEKLYEERTAKIEGGIEKAEKAQAEAEQALEQYKAQLAEARTEAAKIRDDARLEAEQIKEELRADAQEEARRIVAQGEAQLQAQRAQIVAELRAELGRNSIELASRIVGEALEDEARRRGTVDRFLAELEASGNGAAGARN